MTMTIAVASPMRTLRATAGKSRRDGRSRAGQTTQCSQRPEVTPAAWRPRVGAALAAAALLAAPAQPAIAGLFSSAPPPPPAAPAVSDDPLEALIDERIRLALEKYEQGGLSALGGTPAANSKGAPAPKTYVPTAQPLDKSKLLAELGLAIGGTLAVTIALESSTLFPTIVAANNQFKSAKSEGVYDDDAAAAAGGREPPPFELDGMMNDARGGLEMVKQAKAAEAKQAAEKL